MSEIVRVEETRRARRRKWRPASPLSSMTIRGMRQPKPVGSLSDDAEVIAKAVWAWKRRVRYAVRVYVCAGDVYALAETYVITALVADNPMAELIGTYSRRASVADIADDVRIAQAERLACGAP